ncbi:hypothetical protein KUCAC02_006930 [Chaenocephalus aceratus]|uniref:Uncharacterized protein n=1 Tax=Chaenocephalus aceratus TaxID=36190 RepID=A0ACB9VUN3_CHAAC|nr:hypothetical protein KUCAC02_006930 [Chaenocephalus aceratus]
MFWRDQVTPSSELKGPRSRSCSVHRAKNQSGVMTSAPSGTTAPHLSPANTAEPLNVPKDTAGQKNIKHQRRGRTQIVQTNWLWGLLHGEQWRMYCWTSCVSGSVQYWTSCVSGSVQYWQL